MNTHIENVHIDFITLNEYLDETLPAVQRAGVDAHLAACPQCRRQLSDLQTLFVTLDELPEAPLRRDLAASVMGAIAMQPQAMNGQTPTAQLPWRLLVVQLVVAGVIVLLVWPWVIQMLPIQSLAARLPFMAWWRDWWGALADYSATIPAIVRAWLMTGGALLQPDLVDTQSWLKLPPPGWGLLLLGAGLCWLAGAYWGFTDQRWQKGEEQ